MIKRIIGFLLPLCTVVTAFPLMASDLGSRPDTRQIIVRLKDDGVRRIQSVQRNQVVPDLRLPDGSPLTFVRRFDGNGMVVRLPQSVTHRQAEQLAAQLAANPSVLAAQADKRMYPALVPFDPDYLPGANPALDSGQWNLFEAAGIRMPAAWDRSTGSAGVVIAQLDTGIVTHRDLNAARILGGYDFITDLFTANDGDARDPDPADPGDATLDNDCGPGVTGETSSWHGLSVASTMVAQSDNGVDMAGIDFAARLLPVRVLGKCGGSVSDVSDALRWAAGLSVAGVPVNTSPARVINMSLSGAGACSPEEQTAIDAAVNAGAVVVVSAGNESVDVSTQSPANCNNVLTIGATLRDGSRALYSNSGDEVTLSAPGGLTTSQPADGLLVLSNTGVAGPVADTKARIAGSSFSTAQVSGVAALMFAVNASLTSPQVQEILRRTTYVFPDSSCTTVTCGSGILDADAALAGAADPGSVLGGKANTGGGGGCSMAPGTARFDPLLLLLLLAGIRYAVRHTRFRHIH